MSNHLSSLGSFRIVSFIRAFENYLFMYSPQGIFESSRSYIQDNFMGSGGLLPHRYLKKEVV